MHDHLLHWAARAVPHAHHGLSLLRPNVLAPQLRATLFQIFEPSSLRASCRRLLGDAFPCLRKTSEGAARELPTSLQSLIVALPFRTPQWRDR